ncbi:hypothetical protein [Alkalicoccus urumqiensis]|uniref:Uncharacterized protein n=1 Tax=Alkalicoccus urumqiensis TaxID=1548213 RepID=A0A2P6MJE3_ALKUR|nr:hypothetical protein [Alkalicoccus urumqiensis]PRO66396.1 hypothetical protein C6I21_03385 [Alkalicoccus urumqiensis]
MFTQKRKYKAGNGRPLKKFRWWQPFSRALFYLPLTNEMGQQMVLAVDVSYWQQFFSNDGKGKAHLYLDGKHYAVSRLPASFPLAGGRIEVASSLFGLKRCHLVTDEGTVQPLIPDPRSAEGRRARLDREHPTLSRWIGVVSLGMVLLPIVFAVPQVIESVTQIPSAAKHFGTFDSPIHLPMWTNIGLGLCAAAGSVERATRLKWNAFLDGSL